MSDVVLLPSNTKPARYHVHVLLDAGVERDVYVCNCDEVHYVLAHYWNGRDSVVPSAQFLRKLSNPEQWSLHRAARLPSGWFIRRLEVHEARPDVVYLSGLVLQ
jgi:hypothetical protein